MLCPDGCDNGYLPQSFKDVDGQLCRFRYVVGVVWMWCGRICLETDDGLVVIDVDPSELEILDETPTAHR